MLRRLSSLWSMGWYNVAEASVCCPLEKAMVMYSFFGYARFFQDNPSYHSHLKFAEHGRVELG